MEAIVQIVRWNGADGVRAWEMTDGTSYRAWLTAFRALLDKCPGAWVDNPVLDSMVKTNPELNVLTASLEGPDGPVKQATRLVIGTHLLLTMRKGRLPWFWFNKPFLSDLRCDHEGI